MLKKSLKSVFKKGTRILNSYCGFTLLESQLIQVMNNFKTGYGVLDSKVQRKPLDNNLNPIPWFTYPALEYIQQFDLSNKEIFEWGSGNSSMFFSALCKSMISVESDKEWYSFVKGNLRPNQKLILCEQAAIPDAIDVYGKFDIVIIDSFKRFECGLKAVQHLKPGGLIILDNSDWYPNTSSFLRVEGNLIEVDMHGFGPINDYTWTTSFYFTRDFNFTPLQSRQPHYSKCAIRQVGTDDEVKV